MSESGKKNDIKNVLIVSISAPPYATPESLQVSKYLKHLVGSNLKLSLVTAKISRQNMGWRKFDKKYLAVLDELAQVIKIPTYYSRIPTAAIRKLYPGWFQKPDGERRFISGWKKVIRLLRSKPDIIYSRSSPVSSTIMAMKLKEYYNVPWILHLSDPWALSPLFELTGSQRSYHIEMEKKCLSMANRICLTSKEQIRLYQQHYPHYKDKFIWFPNVYDDDDVTRIEPNYEDEMIFVHTGNFYGKWRNPAPLLNAIEAAYQENPRLLKRTKFLFAGFQNVATSKLMLEYKQYGVHYLGPLSAKECRQLQRKASVLLIVDLKLPSSAAVFFPSKTLDYLSTGNPILAITAPGSSLFNVVNNVYGHCFQHGDISGIKNHIIEMVSRYESRDIIFKSSYSIDETYSAKKNSQRLGKLMLDQS